MCVSSTCVCVCDAVCGVRCAVCVRHGAVRHAKLNCAVRYITMKCEMCGAMYNDDKTERYCAVRYDSVQLTCIVVVVYGVVW